MEEGERDERIGWGREYSWSLLARELGLGKMEGLCTYIPTVLLYTHLHMQLG